MNKTLVAFGDSCTYGHGLKDCIAADGVNPGKSPSEHAWPSRLAEEFTNPPQAHANLGIPGASNKEIWNKIMNTKLDHNNIVVIGWSLYNRTCVINKHGVDQIGIWQDTKPAKSYFKHLYDDYDMHNDFYLRANHIKQYLDQKEIENYHWRLETTMSEQVPKWNEVRFIDFDYHNLKNKYPLAQDNLHPGEEAHGKIAESLFQHIKGTRSSVG